MIDRLDWYERKNKDDDTNHGYGARFDPLFKGVKSHDDREIVHCIFEVPWWMDNTKQLTNAIKVLKKYHIVPNYRKSESYVDEDYEAYKDYVENAGPKYADRKKKKKPVTSKRKCRCKK